MSIFQLLNGLTFAALLFVVASGFTLIFGLLRIVNLAHGALYLFGGYIGFTVAVKTGSFVLGGVGAMAAIAAIGFVLDQGLLRFVRGNELRQVLLTLGVAFFLNAFLLGAALAGLGGLMGGAFLSLYPSADAEILVFSLAVVIIGGRGSLVGVGVGSLLVGLLNTLGQVMFPELAYFVIFGPMAALLAFRPLGLFGRAT